MRLLDRYIFIEWTKGFMLSMGATFGILVLEDLYNNLGDFIEYGANAKAILRYYLFVLPSMLPMVLPVSLLVSVLFSLGNLHRHNEIVAMRASGIGIVRMGLPLWGVGVVAAALLFVLNSSIVPRSTEQARFIYDNLRFAKQAQETEGQWVGHVPQLGFDNNAMNRLWFMNRFSEYTYMGYGITLHLMDAQGQETERIMAREGYFDDVDDYWVFKDGRHLTFDATGLPERSVPFDELADPRFTESPSLMLTLRKRPIVLSLSEIKAVLEALDPEAYPQLRAYAVRRQSIHASPANCLLAVLIGVPFAVVGVRTNPMIGVAKAAGLFFAYFLASSFTTLLGEQGIISAELAAWLPAALALLAACYFISRVR